MSLFTEGLSRGACNTELLCAHGKSLDNTLMEERKVFMREGDPRSERCIVLSHKCNACVMPGATKAAHCQLVFWFISKKNKMKII